jgi:hypothetical protein
LITDTHFLDVRQRLWLDCPRARVEVNFELAGRLAEREERIGPALAGFATSRKRSFEIRELS